MRKRRVAFVVQRYGRDVNGGAESLCKKVAEHMVDFWDVEILTTCAVDYANWENTYPAGIEYTEGLRISRFPVSTLRDKDEFDELSRHIISKAKPSESEVDQWMKSQGPFSEGLIDHLEKNSKNYDCVIFFTYLYATTWFCLPLVHDKALLVPFAHDEWTIHLDIWDDVFGHPHKLIFSTPTEKQFIQKRFRNLDIEGPIVGVAIDRPDDIDPSRFRAEFDFQDNYLLYVGRVDESKGCLELFRFYADLCATDPQAPKLLMLGKPVIEIPESANIISLGFVDESTKWDALAGCTCLVMPSRYESLSMVLLESWLVAKPVLVNGHCEVLVDQCRRANGGLWYTNSEEFQACVDNLLYGGTATVLGKQGYDFVLEQYTWQRVEKQYLELVENCVTNAERAAAQ